MSDDDEFEPRLGRMRAGKARRENFRGQVLKAANLAGGIKGPSGRARRFDGSRIGRGAGVGRVLSSRDRLAAFRQRRVLVKARPMKLGGPKGLDAARAHLRYIQRDGVTREGQPGQLYSADTDRADGKAFIERQAGDRHHFRFIVSPEDGDHYDDLKPLTRRLMTQMEKDLGTTLDWVAVDHYNTGHPHTHIIVRGKGDQGRDLVIARDYISQGLRERAAELVSLDLGPKSDREIEDRLRREMDQERLTSIDRRLLKDMDADRIVSATARDPVFQSLRAGRLQTLGRLGLASEIEPGRWRLADGLDDTLKRMGERGDIIRTLQRAMTEQEQARALDDYAIFDPAGGAGDGARRPLTGPSLTGKVIARGLSDEINDRHYLIVDGTDGRSHYVDIGRGEATGPIPNGAIVRVTATSVEARAVDYTIADIAEAHDGRYSVDIHLRHDPKTTETYAQTHVRRLEAMRRLMNSVEREADGTWRITPDHVEKAAAFEARQARDAPVIVDTLSSLPLERQVGSDGATWLDRQLVSHTPEPLRDAGFGKAARDALQARQQWLIAEDLAQEEQGRILFRANLLSVLRQRELNRVAGQLSDELGLGYVETKSGDRIEGVYRRSVDMASGRYALIEKSREFTLVPWRPVLDRHIDQSVSGILKGDAVNWTIGRGRAGPSVE